MNNFSPSVSYTREQNNQRSHKHLRRKTLGTSKRKVWSDKKSSEYFPLLSGEDSEEEIVLHDLNYIRNRQKDAESKSSNLQNAKRHQHSYSDPFLNCDFMTLELHKNDTLQGISIRYGCAMSDLKRANNIISNQELHGLRMLKIPVKKHSLLVDVLPNDISRLSLSRDDQRNSDNIKTINIGIGAMLNNNNPTQDAAAFLKRMDEDLVKIMLNRNSQKDTLEEVTAALSESCIHPLVENTCTTTENIQWPYLLLTIISIAIVLPLIIVLYTYYLKPSNESHYPTYPNVTIAPTTSDTTNFSER